jgi:hypothetical protein
MADKLGPSQLRQAYNVVPGKVVLGLEDLSFDKIWELFHEIEKAADIAQSSGTIITFKNQLLGIHRADTKKVEQVIHKTWL